MLKEEENVTYTIKASSYTNTHVTLTHPHKTKKIHTHSHFFPSYFILFKKKTNKKMRTLIELSFSHIAAEIEKKRKGNPRLNLLKL